MAGEIARLNVLLPEAGNQQRGGHADDQK
jgi:hypothetical protein